MSRVLFTNGPIITSDGRSATSLAIDDDRIVAIGDEAGSWSPSFDEVVQLNGRAVVAAFHDGHAHPLHAGINRTELDLTEVTSYGRHPRPRSTMGRGTPCGSVDRRPLLRAPTAARWNGPGRVAHDVCSDRPVVLTRPTTTRCGPTARHLPLAT